MVLGALADFLNNELKNKYEVNWRYEHSTNSIVVEMRDGLLRCSRLVGIEDICMRSQTYESSMVVLLRSMMEHIDKYREEERKRLENKNE